MLSTSTTPVPLVINTKLSLVRVVVILLAVILIPVVVTSPVRLPVIAPETVIALNT